MQILARPLDDAHHREKGFTLLEVLMVVAILALLASVVLPNVITYLSTTQVAVANLEVINVETAAVAYYGIHFHWPSDTNTDLVSEGYLSNAAVYSYAFDEFGRVNVEDGTAWPNGASVTWSAADHMWLR